MKLAPKDNWGIRAKKLYESLGFEYTSIDIDNDEKMKIPIKHCYGFKFWWIKKRPSKQIWFSYKLGTSEHIFNQLNFFKTMHDLTKVGGF